MRTKPDESILDLSTPRNQLQFLSDRFDIVSDKIDANVDMLDYRSGRLVQPPDSTTFGKVPAWDNTSGSLLDDGYSVTDTISSPGSSTVLASGAAVAAVTVTRYSLPVIPGETVSAGDVVEYVNGGIRKYRIPGIHASPVYAFEETTYSPGRYNIAVPRKNRPVVMYSDGSQVKVQVHHISNDAVLSHESTLTSAAGTGVCDTVDSTNIYYLVSAGTIYGSSVKSTTATVGSAVLVGSWIVDNPLVEPVIRSISSAHVNGVYGGSNGCIFRYSYPVSSSSTTLSKETGTKCHSLTTIGDSKYVASWTVNSTIFLQVVSHTGTKSGTACRINTTETGDHSVLHHSEDYVIVAGESISGARLWKVNVSGGTPVIVGYCTIGTDAEGTVKLGYVSDDLVLVAWRTSTSNIRYELYDISGDWPSSVSGTEHSVGESTVAAGATTGIIPRLSENSWYLTYATSSNHGYATVLSLLSPMYHSVIGIAAESKNEGETCSIVARGSVTLSELTPGIYYASAMGNLTQRCSVDMSSLTYRTYDLPNCVVGTALSPTNLVVDMI